MLRPTRSLEVTGIDIGPAPGSCNLIKTKSFRVQIVGNSEFASWKAVADWLTLGPPPGLPDRPAFFGIVADEWRGFNRSAQVGCLVLRNQAWLGPEPGLFGCCRRRQPRACAAP